MHQDNRETRRAAYSMKNTIAIVAAFFAAVTVSNAQLSAELIGALNHPDFSGPRWGAGVDVGYDFNKYVTGHVRLIAYEENNWGGNAIDEGSLYVEAKLLRSANGKLQLSATGGGHRDFQGDDWGFGVGLRPSLKLTKKLTAFAASEIRAWFDGPKDLLTTFGLNLKF